jgi:hypothetical protein
VDASPPFPPDASQRPSSETTCVSGRHCAHNREIVLGPHTTREACERRLLGAAIALLLASCVALPGSPPASASAATPNPSALRATLEARFGTLAPGPAYPGTVWSPDAPITLEPRAFGTFPSDRQPGPVVSFDRVRLATALPTAPANASVALVGSYDESWKATVARVVPDSGDWTVVPLYASLSKSTGSSLGPMPTWSAESIDAARAVLARVGLLAPDMEPSPHQRAAARAITFIRRLEGLPIYTNKGVALTGLADGGTSAIGRRRPILALSRYPIRTPADAWAAVQRGEGRTMGVDDGAPATPVTLPEFVVTSVELVYLEVEVLGPRELMQPYYAFREAGGSVLYVPAVVF